MAINKECSTKDKEPITRTFPKLLTLPLNTIGSCGYCTSIKITLDSEEYIVNMNEDLQQKALGIIGTTSRNKPTYNDDIEKVCI